MRQELVPSNDDIFSVIEQIFAKGPRRPVYPADLWTEQFCLQRFQDLGLEKARLEPFEVNYWEPQRWSLAVWSEEAGESSAVELPCFPLPYSPPADVTGPVRLYDAADPAASKGGIAFLSSHVAHLPYEGPVAASTAIYDPDSTFDGYAQVLPFSTGRTTEAILASGAVACIGSLAGYPGDSHEQYVPYRGAIHPAPGAWISGKDGARLADMLSQGDVRARLALDADIHLATSNNVLAELPGADDELVVVGSHHDGPWGSAVEDASGVALVLAQAEYWSRLPREERPHRMLFVLHGGHMAGGAGHKAFVERYSDEMRRIVLEAHLEHACLECEERDGEVTPTGRPEPRWWFTSRIPRLESTVLAALENERLARSLVLPPTVFGAEAPPTDAHDFFLAGVPCVSFLSAPFYLFDSQDTPDKVDRENLAAITRATIRIIESTRGETAKSMRQVADRS
jgi:hypothetical protein